MRQDGSGGWVLRRASLATSHIAVKPDVATTDSVTATSAASVRLMSSSSSTGARPCSGVVKHAIATGGIVLKSSSSMALNCTYANGTGTSFILVAELYACSPLESSWKTRDTSGDGADTPPARYKQTALASGTPHGSRTPRHDATA